jgi:hypothetical protein
MGTFILGTLSGFVIAGCAAIYAKHALIADANTRTDGHF